MIDINGLISGYDNWLSGPNFNNPYSESSIRAYIAQVRQYLNMLDYEGIERIDDAGRHFIKKFITTNRNGDISSRNTQIVRMSAIIAFYDWMETVGIIEQNIAHDTMQRQDNRNVARGGRIPKRLPTVLEHDEIERLRFDVGLSDTIAGIRNAALLSFMLSTGLRASEVCAYQANNINGYATGRLRIIGKGDKERLVRFPQPPIREMETWLSVRGNLRYADSALFLSDEGRKLTRNGLYQIIHRMLERAGIHKAQKGPHLLRHTAASLWLAAGMDLRRVQENLGHSNIAITSRYLHLLEGDHHDGPD